ncbi:TonB-dependent receptor, partial [Sphingomonas aquatilis]
MKVKLLIGCAVAAVVAQPAQTRAQAQSQAGSASGRAASEAPADPTPEASAAPQAVEDIVVTAQRQSQRLQDVPIAVSAFTSETLERQQIVNPTALQQSLPSITFTKTNFTGSSFTIRGIGDLCTGTTCDQATAVHVNDMPLLSTRLFESEFFDLERVEVLRGPQGTLFGRNATSGVINFITAKPDLNAFHAAGEIEYGNYDSRRARGMLNLPITSTLGIRLAGTYLKRDGYTYNSYNDTHVDDRDLYAVRGTLSWEPTSDTRVDLMGYYFHENDRRARIQKQLCHRDPTGVLGCSPDRLAFERGNGNAVLANVLSSTEFFRIATGSAAAGAFGLGSIYGSDPLATTASPADLRTVSQDYDPTYFAEEEQYQLKLYHDFGKVSFNLTGGYTRNVVDSTTDYTQSVAAPLTNNAGLLQLQNLASLPTGQFNALFPRAGGVNPFAPLARVLIPNGAAGGFCQSAPTTNDGGVYSGASAGCLPNSLDFDRSTGTYRQYSAEGHIDSEFAGAFNFLLGGIYAHQSISDNDYYVTAAGVDYGPGLLPSLAKANGALPATLPPVMFSTPYFRSNADAYRLNSYGVFGEAYLQFSPKVKLTLGARYNHDDKYIRARTTYLIDSAGANPLLPYGATALDQALNYASLDYDVTRAGAQPFAEQNVKFSRLTGRAVLDYRITRDNLVYASYSRGYKSGGINPPVSPIFAVPVTFRPESIDAFEIGSKNTFAGGQLRLNLTGFYYRYKDLQLARIVSRT